MLRRIQFVLLLLCVASIGAQARKTAAAVKGEELDRIVAVVGNDILLESDVLEEMRYAQLQPYRLANGDTPREQALNRLIDRTLILQQEAGYVQTPVTDKEVDDSENQMREDLPACLRANCKTDTGWKQFLADQKLTEKDLRNHLKQRIAVLRFIQQRFRNGIHITDEQVQEFYTKTMLPQYEKEHVQPPPVSAIHDRIEEVLLQQQVSVLLDDWLKTLHEEGQVRILNQGEEAP